VMSDEWMADSRLADLRRSIAGSLPIAGRLS
jgi:hypothetical protein